LRSAFADKKAKGVVLRISSPGGSPTQSILIHDEIIKLRSQYPDKKFVISGEESMTSGAMWIASSSPYINVLPATITGSIGVISAGWDLSDFIEKFDVKRRIITAGVNKHRLDTFVKPRNEDLEKIKNIMSQLHQQFINTVKEGRGGRLKGDPKELYSGDFWLGEQALEYGLVDRVGSTQQFLIDQFGTDTVKDFSKKPGMFDGLKLSNPLASMSSEANAFISFLVEADVPSFH
jgi:protease-4